MLGAIRAKYQALLFPNSLPQPPRVYRKTLFLRRPGPCSEDRGRNGVNEICYDIMLVSWRQSCDVSGKLASDQSLTHSVVNELCLTLTYVIIYPNIFRPQPQR
jgi:hypothetical protein